MAKILLNVAVDSKKADEGLRQLKESLQKIVTELGELKPNKDLTAQLNALARSYSAVEKAATSELKVKTQQAALEAKLAKLEADSEKAIANKAKATSDAARAAEKAVQEIEKTREATAKANTAEEKLEQQVIKTAKAMDDYTKSTEDANTKTGFLNGSIGDTIAKFAKAEVAFLAVRTPLNMIKNALAEVDDTLVKTEDAVIEVQRVLDETIPAGEISDRLYSIAYQYGSTFENASQIAVNFARAGRTWNESLEATEAALLAMNVAELNATEASDGLLSILAQFGMETSELTNVVDKLNKTADKNPVSTQKLLQAIQRSGSAAKNANVSFDQTLGLITAISEATNRGGQNIGTAINSLIQYSQKNVDVFSTLSDESAAIVEKFKMGLASIVDVWQQVAIDIHNDKQSRDNIISALGTDGLEELSSTLHDELGDLVSEINGVYDVANTYRKNYFIALLDNMDRFMDVQEQLTEYQGYSQEENAKYMETYTAKVNQLQTAWQALANDEQGILGLKKTLVEIGISVVDLVDATGGISVNIVRIASAAAGIGILLNAEKLATGWASLASTLQALPGYLKGTASAALSTQAAFGWIGIAIAALGILTTTIIGYNNKQKEARQETINLWKANEKNSETLLTLKKKYEELNPESEEYYDVEDKIVKLLSEDKQEALEQITKGTDDYRKAVENLTESELEYYKLLNYDAKQSAEKSLKAAFPTVTLNDDYFRSYLRSDTPDRKGQSVYKYSTEELFNEYQDFVKKFEAIEDARARAITQGNKKLADDLKERYDGMKAAIDKYSGVMGDYEEVVKRQTELDNYSIESTEKTVNAIDNLASGSGGSFNQIVEDGKKASDAVEDLAGAAEKAAERINKYNDAIEYYLDISNEIKERGIDVSQTIFGNIDTNNRQVLEWTEENIERFRSALESWGMTAREIEELSGELSTVFGASEWFGNEENGMEIAFSPILQTPDGPILLEADTVRTYIEGILEEAGENPTKEKILRLDTQGIEQDGMVIRNLIAGIGDEAIKVGEAMHYSGTDGAFAQAFEGLKQYAEELGVSVEDLVQQYNLISREEIYGTFDKIAESEKNLTTVTKDLSSQIDDVQNALSVLDAVQAEYGETGYLSIDTLQKLVELGGEYLALIIDEEGQIRLNQGAVDDLVESKKTLLEKLIDEQTVQYAVTLINEKMAESEGSVGSQAEAAAKRVAVMVAQVRELAGDSQGAALALEGLKTALAQIGDASGVSLTDADLEEIAGKTLNYNQSLRNLLANSVNTSSSGWRSSSGSSSSSTKDEYLESLKDAVSLRESELTLMEHQGVTQDQQIAKIKQIQAALAEQADYMRSIGASQTDINKLSSEWWKWQEKINKFAEENAKAAEKAAEEQKKAQEEAKKAAEEAIKAETARLKQVVADDKARLTLMEKQGKSVAERVDMMKNIQSALHDEAEWLRKIGATQAEIDALSAEWWDWQEKILKLYKETLDAARDIELDAIQKTIDGILKEVDIKKEELALDEKRLAVTEAEQNLVEAISEARIKYVRGVLSDYIQSLSDAKTLEEKQNAVIEAREKLMAAEREARAKAIIDSFNAEKDGKGNLLSLEERRLAVEKAREALREAQENRTTRVYNEASGQWEYQADAKNVQTAQDNLKKAVDALNEFIVEAAWDEVAQAVEKGSVSESEVLAILEKWAKEAYGEGSPEYVQKITAAYRKAMGTPANPDSLAGQVSAVDSAVESLNDYLKNEAVKELEKYIADGNTSQSGMKAILDRWLSMGEGGELYEWRDGLLGTVTDAIESGYYDDRDVLSATESVERAVESLHDYLENRFISEVSDLVRNGTAEELRDFIDQQSRIYDEDDVPLDWANRLYSNKSRYEETSGQYDRLYNGQYTEDEFQMWLARMKANSAAWWTTTGDERKELEATNMAIGQMLGLIKGSDGAWYYPDGTRVYDKGGLLYGMGGIKATNRPEAILDPELTAKLLQPQSEAAFKAFTDAMHILFGGDGRTPFGGFTRNGGISDSHNVSNVINGIPISPSMAETHTIAELCRLLPLVGRA